MAEPIQWQGAWWHQQPDGSWLCFNEQTQQWEPGGAPPAVQPVYQPQTGMSTGAKVAVGCAVAFGVLLILGIIAAIAIPVALNEHEKEFTAEVESDLKNAAVAEEVYFTEYATYTTSVEELEESGYQPTDGVEITVERANENRYCLEGRHEEMDDDVWSYDSLRGSPRKGPCV